MFEVRRRALVKAPYQVDGLRGPGDAKLSSSLWILPAHRLDLKIIEQDSFAASRFCFLISLILSSAFKKRPCLVTALQLTVRAARLMVTTSSGVFVVPPSDSG